MEKVTRMIWRSIFNIQCEDLMMLDSLTKLSLLFKILAAGWVELDELLDKTTVQ